MTDYRQQLVPPNFRNLVINPGGEASSLGAAYMASNGTVTVGSEGFAPLSGTGVVEYEVVASTSLSYFFAPLGPQELVHRGGFKIPSGRTVSMRVSLAGNATVWVRVHASWMVETWEGGQPSGLTEIVSRPVGAPVQLSTSGMTTVELLVGSGDIPEGATHWRPLVSVFSANPTVSPAAPAVGTKVWADEFFVTDSGASLAGVPHVSGDVAGYAWEGEPDHSSSTTSPEGNSDPLEDAPASTGEDSSLDVPLNEEPVPEDPPAVSEEPPPMPVVPDAGVDDHVGTASGEVLAGGRPRIAVAEDTLGWRRDSRHLCLKGDVQIGDLVMNEMDDQGVVWLVSDIDGWWTTPEPDVPDVQRGWFDGSYETRGRYTSRTFTLSGSFVPRHPGDVAGARDRLIRAINLVHRGGWFMTHEGAPDRDKTKGAKVWMVGSPLIATTGLNGKTDFSVALRAPDPMKYSIKDGVPPGYNTMRLITSSAQYPERALPRKYPWAYPEAVFGSTVADVINEGNAVVWPTLRIDGPTNGPLNVYNADTGQKFRIVRKLYPGETLVVDCFTKQVTLNGQGNFRFYLDVDVDWLMLQPGPNRLYFSEEELGGIRTELEVQWRSGWIG